MKPETKIPRGWRKLYPRTKIIAGDKYNCRYVDRVWHSSSDIGSPVLGEKRDGLTYIRKVTRK